MPRQHNVLTGSYRCEPLPDTAGRTGRNRDRVERSRDLGRCHAGEIPFLLIVVKEKEQLVLYDRAADSCAELIANVLRLNSDEASSPSEEGPKGCGHPIDYRGRRKRSGREIHLCRSL